MIHKLKEKNKGSLFLQLKNKGELMQESCKYHEEFVSLSLVPQNSVFFLIILLIVLLLLVIHLENQKASIFFY